jgi:hypothetical protein
MVPLEGLAPGPMSNAGPKAVSDGKTGLSLEFLYGPPFGVRLSHGIGILSRRALCGLAVMAVRGAEPPATGEKARPRLALAQ